MEGSASEVAQFVDRVLEVTSGVRRHTRLVVPGTPTLGLSLCQLWPWPIGLSTLRLRSCVVPKEAPSVRHRIAVQQGRTGRL
jgi:hypothetical protein